jgi:2-polyprenyl-3-methyl-5-hydroxy-6-metoxy-1,4-benzoquinol methylase
VSLDHDAERARLEKVAADRWYERGANGAMIRYCASLFARHWRGGRCLELGPAEGVMTEWLMRDFDQIEIVDGSEAYCSALRLRFPGARVHRALFEEFEPDGSFDAIVVGHVLEHVADPRALLARCRPWLADGGTLYAAVPNARSLHRQAAVLMGLLTEEHELNDTDRHHGHRRVYDPESLRADILRSGLSIRVFGGFWIKPVSNAQIEETWTDAMLDAFLVLGERYPDVAAEIYVVAEA